MHSLVTALGVLFVLYACDAQRPEAEFTERPANVSIVAGSHFILRCSGSPGSVVTWKQGRDPVSNTKAYADDRMFISPSNHLLVIDAEMQDSGDYTCRLRHGSSSARAHALVRVDTTSAPRDNDDSCAEEMRLKELEIERLERALSDRCDLEPEVVVRHVRDGDDCSSARGRDSGVYPIQPIGLYETFDVYCEMAESGAWTVIQHRQDGSVNFTRNWADYKVGFGNVNAEHWIGNDNIFRLTNQASYKLRIDLEKPNGDTAYAVYDSFWIEDENNNYRLHLGKYSGTAGDAMKHNIYGVTSLDGQSFSTYDRDNDSASDNNCASYYSAGWWFNGCTAACLNGKYTPQEEWQTGDRIVWLTWSHKHTLKSSTMKIQKTDN